MIDPIPLLISSLHFFTHKSVQFASLGFPDGLVVKNTSTHTGDAGDTGSIPGPGGSHLPGSHNYCSPRAVDTRAPGLVVLCPTTREQPSQLEAVKENPCPATNTQLAKNKERKLISKKEKKEIPKIFVISLIRKGLNSQA